MTLPSAQPIVILGIESSCDDTAAAVLIDGIVRSNVVAGQSVHRAWGGVVPELASRAHQESIVPVVHEALRQAGIGKGDLTAIAFTEGPGLMGSLLVGACFARSMAQALGVPLIAVDHVEAHVLAHFIRDDEARPTPEFPFVNLTVSGGHSLIVLVNGPLEMLVLGSTLDDAAGEAFDKGAKLLGLEYPGGPLIDREARGGDPDRFRLPEPNVRGIDMSFSGLKTAFRSLVLKGMQEDPAFIERNLADLCASLQRSIVDMLMRKLYKAARQYGVERIGIGGGVSANTALREAVTALGKRENWTVYIPPFAYCTDNAAMIAMVGHHKYLDGRYAGLDVVPRAR